MKPRECKDAREFKYLFRKGVWRRTDDAWKWAQDLCPWIAQKLDGVKFGHPGYDWSTVAADDMAAEFVREASTW
ncbi:MAG: hypothetical protein ACEQSU_16605 [Microgenomates group bacterium]